MKLLTGIHVWITLNICQSFCHILIHLANIYHGTDILTATIINNIQVYLTW